MSWELTDHACRICHGRVLARREGDRLIHRCAQCGAQVEGDHDLLCVCGVESGGRRIAECFRMHTPGLPEVGVRVLENANVREQRVPRFVGGD